MQEEFVGVVARACPERIRRVESLRPKEVPVLWGRGRWGSPRGTPAKSAGAGVEGLFESLLSESFSS